MLSRIFGSFNVKIQGALSWISGSVTFVQGAGMTLTQDPVARTITFVSTGGGGGGIQQGPTLPPANSGNRGIVFLLQGGVGVPDTLYVCAKDYLDAYNWNEIVLIT